jgi:hypothetical protein
MGIDARYIPLNYLQGYFVNKTTGLPLAGGYVYFYEDNSRTTLKNVFAISGDGTNYSYIELPNPMILSSAGTFVDDSGQDLTVYAYPYDENGDVQLYYIAVYENEFATQPMFTRQAVPNIAEGGEETATGLYNYIPNGQFLTHNDIAATDTHDSGFITQGVTDIAPGGWQFVRPNVSTASDFVTFVRYGVYVSNPSGSPRYAVRIVCSTPSLGDSYKRMMIYFPDVNKFASDTEIWTLSFSAFSAYDGMPITVNLIKNYGLGGDPEEIIPLDSFSLGTDFEMYNVNFSFGTNIAKNIGSNDDDYVALSIDFSPSSITDFQLTDFVLASGDLTISEYPVDTNADVLARGVAGWMPVPAYDGSDLGCSLIASKGGLSWDHSTIGSIMIQTTDEIPVGYLLADGSQYETEIQSSDGIPYSRLQSKYWISDIQTPRYGTGPDYFTATYPDSGSNFFTLVNNDPGTSASITDGSTQTHFTFTQINNGDDDGYGIRSYMVDNDVFIIEPNIPNDDIPATAGTTSFIVTSVQNGNTSITNAKIAVLVATPSALSNLTGEKLIDGVLTNNSRVLVLYGLGGIHASDKTYNGIWVTSTGAWARATDADTEYELVHCVVPVKSGDLNGGKIFYNTNNSITIGVTQIHFSDFSGEQVGSKEITQVQTVDGYSVNAGQYFTFSSFDLDASTEIPYYVWYKVDGVGTEPTIPGATGIQVNILSTDSSNQVAIKTQQSLNGWAIWGIQTIAGNLFHIGAYFLASSPTVDYYIWYTVNGVGEDPKIVNRVGVHVNVLTTDSDADIALKTQSAINSKFFAVPKANGLFLRATNHGNGFDINADSRWSMVPGIMGDQVGTMQNDSLKSHSHYVSNATWSDANCDSPETSNVIAGRITPSTGYVNGLTQLIQQTGNSSQSYPINFSVNCLIKY